MIGRLAGLLAIVGGAAGAGEAALRSRDGAGSVPEIHSLVVIDAPIDAVWGVVADVEGQPRWMRDLKAVSILTPGRIGVGTRAVGRVRILGIGVDDPVEITAFDRPHRFAIRHDGRFRGGGELTLEPGADGTTTIVRWAERLVPPVLPHLAARFGAPVLRHVFQADLQRLRRLVETGTTD